MARFYSNENFPRQVVEELRRHGHDVLTSHEAGNSGRGVPDEDVLDFATSDRRCVLTLNRKHFIRLHHRAPGHSGILVCTYDPDFVDQATRIHEEVAAHEDLAGRLLRVNRRS